MERDIFTLLPQKKLLHIDNPVNVSINNLHLECIVIRKTFNNQQAMPLSIKLKRKMFCCHYTFFEYSL